jgi:hypothetical protein
MKNCNYPKCKKDGFCSNLYVDEIKNTDGSVSYIEKCKTKKSKR